MPRTSTDTRWLLVGRQHVPFVQYPFSFIIIIPSIHDTSISIPSAIHPSTNPQPHTFPSTLTYIVYMCNRSASPSPYIQHEHHLVNGDQSLKVSMQLQFTTAKMCLRILTGYRKQTRHVVRMAGSDCCYSPVYFPARSLAQPG